ncbi:kalirin [Clonorchis sinensis]|uniref:Kalirin n=1 Tax=Clonorchis sinensis TaxID=79923 RepID=H2KVC7_CLOSI|nr:kalirin [Clonorchis sinensis]
MNYSNSSLDPEVLEFYCPNRSKNARCHAHHHIHQPHPQRLHGTHPGSHQQAQPGAYRHSQPVCPNAAAPQSQSSAHSTSKTYHGAPQHAPPQHAQQRFGASEHFHHHSGHRYRSSISPVQALPSTCGSSVSTLNSSSGYCTAGSTAHSVGVSSVTSRKMHLRARDHVKLLREKIALLPGGRSRQGGPLLCFPSNSRAHDIPYDDLCLLVCYLTYLPDESVKKAGFSVIVDMRNGTTWNNVKPILRAVEQCVVPNVAITYIIKPDNFFEKHKANMQIGKFNFEIQLVSLATLFREVDPSQLTAELEGTLPYHHEEWIKIRCCVEEFFFSAQDMMDQFGHLFNLLKRKLDLDTVERAKLALEEHRSLRSKIVQAPVSAIEAEADRLTTWLLFGMTAATVTSTNAGGSQSFPASASAMNAASAGGASFLSTSWVSMNPDFQKLIPQVRRTFTTLNEFRTHLQQKWEDVRSHLEQIYQLRLFEEDANRMATWLGQRRHLFLTEHVDIGQTACHAADLLAEHRQFVEACSAAFDTVARLNGVARILADVGHFASQQILKQAAQIEHEWKSFVSALEDRSQVLCLSASFHARAQAFLANCPNRATAMQQVNGNTVHELNQALLTLQNYWQEAQTAHMEVCVDGKALTDHLSAPVPTGSHTSLTAAVDYSQGRKHCTDLVHEIWDRLKLLERVYNERRTRLNSRLTLLMFKEDVGQVLAWLTEHGEPFLHRQTAVGKSIQRAEQLYNTHMQFEQVAATTLLNAEKLISVADELAAQADDPEEVLQRANELLTRISAFTQAVEARRETVDLGCGFYNHTKEVIAWLHAVKESHNTGEHLPATIEGMEDELTNFHRDRSAIEEGADRVATEGETLISRLKDTEEVTHIRSVLAQVASERSTVSALLMERQVRLDLCLQLRLFEADVNSALDCLRHGIPSFSQLLANRNEANSLLNATATTQSPVSSSQFAWLADPRQAPDIASLEELSSVFMSVLPAAEEVLNKGGELIRAFESLGVNFPAGGPGSSDSGVGDSAETAMERVHRLSNELAEVVTFVDELNEKINGELEWRRLEQQSKQVLLRISQCEDMMRDTAIIPANLSEAQSLQTEHEKFQPVLNEAHPRAVQCASKASLLLHQTANYSSSSGLLSSSTGGSSAMEHPRRKDFRAVGEAVTEHWQKLVYAAEDRHKLLVAATNWYKTSDQVTSVLWSLEKEYRREEDWCQNEKAMSDTAGYLNQLSMKHAEQKEAFLKACMLARRTSDLFSRYLHRQSPTTPGRKEVEEKMRTAMSELMAKEQAVLEAWAVRRRRLDDCIYFINIKGRVEELLTRVQQQSSLMHSPSKDIGMTVSSQLASSLCQEVNRACESLESMIAASMPLSPGHTTQLRSLLKRLQSTLPQPSPSAATAKLSISGQDVSQKPQGEQRKLSAPASVTSRLDIASRPKRPDTDTDRTSVSSTSSSGAGSTSTGASDVFLGSGSAASATGPTQEQRRMIRRRENLLHELIQTERSYVQALEQCLATYKQGLLNPPSWPELKVPPGLSDMVNVLFGNMPALFEFHKQTFEPELGKYTESGDFLPEDVGHCFVVYSERLADLYVDYCVNYTESTRLYIEQGQAFFSVIQRYFNLTEPLPSYLIKPVQRVTKYQLLLRELRDCCDPASVAELNEGLEAMLDVPKRANDALHLSMLHGLPDDLPIHSLGDVILQDQFTVWEPKQLIKKSRERRVFLFDNCLILAKEASTQPGEHKAKYHYKSRLLLAECNITEHIEGDQCKFALWTGRVPPIHEYRMVLKASSLDLKQTWVRALREGMRERMFSVQSLYQHHQQSASTGKTGVLSEDAELLDTHYILENYQASRPNELSVSAHQIVQVLHRCDTPNLPLVEPGGPDSGDPSKSVKLDPHASGEWAYIRMLVQGTGTTTTTQSPIKEGFIPARLIGAPSGRRSSTTRNRSANASGRRWLLAGSDVRRGAGSGLVPGKRGSKADLNQTQGFPTPYPTATPRVLSTDRQPPKLNAAPVDIGSTILDNVSEESIDVELPPPMTELQVLPTTTQPEVAATEQTLEEAHKVQDDGDVASSKTAVVVESNGRSSAEQIPEDDVLRKSPQVQHRLAAVAEVAGDGRIDMSNVPSLVGLPIGANLSGLGDLRLHGGLNVAAKLVAGPRPVATGSQSTVGPDEEMLRGVFDEGAELHFVSRYLFLYDQALVIADAAVELLPTDEETSPTSRRRLQCQFRHALPISQISIMEDVGAPGSKPTSEQLLWFCLSERARTTVSTSPLDSAGGGGNHSNSPPPPSSAQSYLCYVVAPRSPDTRVRWLTELTAMVVEARRLSQAFATSSPLEGSSPNGDAGLLMHSKLTSAAAVALYPSGMLFDQSLMELPKLGLIQVGSLNPGSRWKVTPTSSSSLSAPKSSDLPSFLEGLHLTATSSA